MSLRSPAPADLLPVILLSTACWAACFRADELMRKFQVHETAGGAPILINAEAFQTRGTPRDKAMKDYFAAQCASASAKSPVARLRPEWPWYQLNGGLVLGAVAH